MAAALALFACAIFYVPAGAGEIGTTAGGFLRFAPSPRGTGMGEAYTAVSEDAYSAWWNPAGLASIELPELGATYNASIQDVSHQYVSFAYPLHFGSTLGLNITRLSVEPFQGYDATGWETRQVDSVETAIGGAYGRTLLKDEIERPVFNVGANLKAINSRLDEVSATAFALDLGAIYYVRPDRYWMSKAPAQEFRFGLSVKNLGTALTYDKESFALPMSATLGAAWISHPWGAHTLTLALDQTMSNDDGYIVGVGAEYIMFQLLAFRGGFKTGQEIGSGVRAGVGFKLSFLDLDYSMSPFGELGSMHKLGLSMRFGLPRARQPLEGKTARVAGGKMLAPKDKIAQLGLYASDYIELARKDLEASRYVSAGAHLSNAFNLEPSLKDGPWGGRASRLEDLSIRLRLKDTPAREAVLQKENEQARVAHEAIMAYVEGQEVKAFVLAHAAVGSNLRGDAVFEQLIYSLGELTRSTVRRDELLPRQALVKEKLKKSARYFYMQRFDLAGKECEEVTLVDEKNPLGWTRLGSAYYMMGDKDKSKRAYQKALELNPGDTVTKKFMEAQGWK